MRLGPSWGKKDKHGDPSDPADREQGSYWDHVLIDADSRLIVTLVIGRRETQTARQAFADFYRRTDGDLIPHRTPAMAAGLTDHSWSMAEILTYPLFPAGQRPKNSQRRDCENERSEGG
jgi:hypothetical protein